MKLSKKIYSAAVVTTALGFCASANATVFDIDYHDAGVWAAYDTENESYAMKFRADQGKDGFWLVVTDGDNPKGDGSSHAILYGDITNNRITAYTYEGTNSANSYQTGKLLGTYENAFSSGGVHPTYGYEMTMFSLDVSGVNNSLDENFDGIVLGEKAGIWFHQSAGSNFTYGEDGSIVDYDFSNQMWLDRGNDVTLNRGSANCLTGEVSAFVPSYLSSCASTEISGGVLGSSSGNSSSGGGSVPAPGGLALILVGLAGLGRKFRSK